MNKKIILIVVGIFLLALTLFIFIGRGKIEEKKVENSYSFLSIKKGDVLQSVNVDGTVLSTKEVDLRFQLAGKIKEINYQAGDEIKKGDIIASLNSRDQEIAVKQREASLAQSLASLNLKLAGVSDEDIAVYQSKINNAEKIVETTKKSTTEDSKSAEAKVSSAQIALENATTALATKKKQNEIDLSVAYEKAQRTIDAAIISINDILDDVNDILDDDDLDDLFSVKDLQYKTESNDKYRRASESFATISNKMMSDMNYSETDNLLTEVKINLDNVRDLLNSVFSALVNSVTSSSLTQSDIETYKANVNVMKTSVNIAISNIENNEQSILQIKTGADASIINAKALISTTQSTLNLEKSNLYSVRSKIDTQNIQAENSLQLANDEFALKTSDPRSVDIAYLQARVNETSASLDLARENLNKTKLFSPIDGFITNIEFEVGESVNTSNIFINLTSKNKKIEANIPEIEIAKVNINDKVKIILDAFPNKVFDGSIISIDPVDTSVQGVIYYNADITFSNATSSQVVLPGMTADIDIVTDYRNDVLTLPKSSVKIKDGKYYVQVYENEEIKNKDILVGLLGNEKVEIISGVSEVDKIVDFLLK